VRALEKAASAAGYEADLLKSVEAVNNRQKQRLFENICKHFDDDLNGKTIAVGGLSFKAKTDDMREASSRVLMEALWDAGAQVRAYDPEALAEARRLYSGNGALTLCETAHDAVSGADALAIMTEWQEFRSPDFTYIKQELKEPVIFDGRNLYDPAVVEALGLAYYGIGRGRSVISVAYTGPDRRSS
jgi:UDPglucose 6-dehydrogenase